MKPCTEKRALTLYQGAGKRVCMSDVESQITPFIKKSVSNDSQQFLLRHSRWPLLTATRRLINCFNELFLK